LQLHTKLHAFAAAGALSVIGLALAPHGSTGAQADPKAEAGTVKITGHKTHVVAGARARVTGVYAGASGRTVRLERRAGRGWHVEDLTRTDAAGRFKLGFRPSQPGTARLRVRFPAPAGGVVSATPGVGPVVRTVGRLNVYRRGVASVYGPGLYGSGLACGGRLSPSTLGVASKSLPCGARVTFRHGTHTVTVPVVDRGPYVGGRDWDLTMATARKLGFGYGVGTVLSTK
jgi:rare lipoprotein A